MNFEEWMEKNSKIANIYVNNQDIDDIFNSEAINMKEDFEFFCNNAFLDSNKFISITRKLLDSNQLDIIEQNIDKIDLNYIELLSQNDQFKGICLKNLGKILESKDSIDYKKIACLINEPQLIEYIKSNSKVFFEKTTLNIADLVKDISESNNFDENILLQNQEYLFQGITYLSSEIIQMEKIDVDINEYLQGIIANLPYVVEEGKDDFQILFQKTNEIIEKLELSEKENSDIKSQILLTVEQNGNIHENVLKYIKENSDNNKSLNLIKQFRKLGIDKEILNQNQSQWLNIFKGKNILKYVNDCREYEGIPDDYTLSEYVEAIYSDNELLDDVDKDIIKQLIKEISSDQGLDPMNIQYLGQGAYSTNLKIGEYVLKTGSPRGTDTIPNSKRILAPIIRQNVTKSMFVEVQDVVDAQWYEGMDDKEVEKILYEIYSDLRDEGIYWTDIKKENVGRLLRDNTPEYMQDGQVLPRFDTSVQMTGDLAVNETLKKGDYVIIDTDYIFTKETAETGKSIEARHSYHRQFGEEYNRTHSKNTGNVISKEVEDFNKSLQVSNYEKPNNNSTTDSYKIKKLNLDESIKEANNKERE